MKPILVVTDRKGVIAGLVPDDQNMDATTMALESARFVLRGRTTGGIAELAEVGPNPSFKLGNISNIPSVRGITIVLEITTEAWDVWMNHVNS